MKKTLAMALLAMSCAASGKPNIILMMTDDHGWGDVGFNGNEDIITPHLDRVCEQGARFHHFFAAAPVCSPTRGSVLTGRHYFRYGIWGANDGRLPRQEYTIAQGLKDVGYRTGHFGKWHVGSPHPNYTGKGGGGSPERLALPQWFGYDKHFVTHHAVCTWNPYGEDGLNGATTDNPYWEDGKRVTERLIGQMPEKAAQMRKQALAFIASCKQSYAGKDYPDNHEPLGKWKTMKNTPWEPPQPKTGKKNKRKERTRGSGGEEDAPARQRQ